MAKKKTRKRTVSRKKSAKRTGSTKKPTKRKAAKKKTAGRKKTRKKSASSGGARRTKLSLTPTADIVKELERREGLLGKLEAKRDQVLAELEKIEAEITAFSGGSARRGRPPASTTKRRGRPRSTGARKSATPRKRPRNEMNLVEALSQVLKGKTMGVSEVTMAVQKAGYKTTSPNFRTIVNQTLINNGKTFKKISRGQYTAK